MHPSKAHIAAVCSICDIYTAFQFASLNILCNKSSKVFSLKDRVVNIWDLAGQWHNGGSVGLKKKVMQLCLTLWTAWTIAHQAPLSMELSRQEYWSG